MTRTNLKRTSKHVHLTQFDGLQINRTIYTDGTNEYIKINDFVFDLWQEIDHCNNWKIDFIW